MLRIFNKRKLDNVIKISTNKSIAKLRERIKILIVDDQKPSDLIDILRERGYRIFYKENISYQIETEPFDIILLDIKGIAAAYGSSDEGFGFALALKKDYPEKVVVSYSGESNQRISERLNEIDGFISKDTSADTWCSKLDGYIKKYCSVNYQWDAIAKKLKDNGINDDTINSVKDEFISSFSQDTFGGFNDYFINTIEDLKISMDLMKSIISLVKIFG
ncbi:hypothetical protein LTX13_002355 [Clostridium perfringens]|nr:hypothetical protein [Clostridium perfringens]MDM0487149.1 hypothetical protein [Clostridium perfringens]MDM0950471.1 hypothetical protein [Clostridium perfringens]MDU2663519.1 hypothetical protein [Clostridium perfringens]HAT4349131.1 hypothetical protein [Clostridium perfringens]